MAEVGRDVGSCRSPLGTSADDSALCPGLDPLLTEISAACAGGSIDYERVLAATTRYFSARGGTIHMLESDGMLHLKAHGSGMPNEVLNIISVIPIGKGMAGLAAERGEPVSSCNIQSDTSGNIRPGAARTLLKGAIAVPVLDGEIVVGVLGIGKGDEHEFTPAEAELLIDIGQILGKAACLSK